VIFDAVSEGTHVILGMLVVGLVFLTVIVLGELANHLGPRRAARKQTQRSPY
jgi:predicted membrane protein